MQIQKIGIIGHGAVGIMYGDALTRAFGRDNVFFIADRKRAERYRAEGASLNGVPCGFRYASEDDTSEKADLLLFTVKYTGLTNAIEIVRNFVREDTIFVSALNGVVSERDIAAAYGEAHLLYCSVQGMDATKEGANVTRSNSGYFALGLAQGGTNADLQSVCAVLDRAGLRYQLPEDIRHQLWSKCMLNVGVNQVTAARGLTYRGVQQPGEAREEMLAAMREAQQAAACEGVTLAEEEIEQWVALMDSLDPDGMTSMRQDTLHKRKTELELFAGTICRIGREHGFETPVNDSLYARIRALEASF